MFQMGLREQAGDISYGGSLLSTGAMPQEALNLTFVITPEPATLALLLVGGMALLRRRRWGLIINDS